MSSKTNMEPTIQTLKGDNQELMKENASLKRQIGGFKASNYRYKKQAKNDALYVKSLQNDLEKKAEQIASLNATVKGKDRVIAELNRRIANNKNIIQDLKGERDVAIANYEYVCELPWYKRAWFNPNASKNAK